MNDSFAQQDAHRAFAIDRLAAGWTKRRQRDVERPAARCAQPARAPCAQRVKDVGVPSMRR